MKTLAIAEESMLSNLTGFLGKLLSVIFVFLAPIKMVIFAVIFLVLADLVSGIWAAMKRGEEVTSNGFRRTVTKIGAYLLSVITAWITETNLVPDLPLLKVVTAMIAITEIKSFFENLEHITGLDFWGSVLNKLQGQKKYPKKRKK